MYLVIFVTAKNLKEAKRIAKKLLEQKIVACVNIISGVQSFFWWQGRIDQSKEVLLILKSKKNLIKKIVHTVKSLHSYSLPEIIALPIVDGYKDYLDWIEESVSCRLTYK